MSRLASKSIILATLLVPLLGAPAIAVTLDKQTMARINHVIECAKWLLHGDPRHARFCTPSHVTLTHLHDLTNFAGRIEETSPTSSSCPSYSYEYSYSGSGSGSGSDDCDD